MIKKILVASFLMVSIMFAGLLHSLVVYSEETAVEKVLSYLRAQPQTAWGSMALAGNNESNIDLDHLKTVPVGQQSATSYAKNIWALVANDQNPTNLGVEDYVVRLRSY